MHPCVRLGDEYKSPSQRHGKERPREKKLWKTAKPSFWIQNFKKMSNWFNSLVALIVYIGGLLRNTIFVLNLVISLLYLLPIMIGGLIVDFDDSSFLRGEVLQVPKQGAKIFPIDQWGRKIVKWWKSTNYLDVWKLRVVITKLILSCSSYFTICKSPQFW